MEVLSFIIYIRGLFFLLVFLTFLILTFIFRLLKKKNKHLENATKFLGFFVIALLIFDSVKDNYLLLEKNISTETVNFLVDAIDKDSESFYKGIDNENVTISGPYNFDEDYFDLWSVDYDKKIPVDLLYENKDIGIYQSRVSYHGTFLFFPIEPFYYESTVYIVRDNNITELTYSDVSLLLFDMDKALTD